METYTIEPIGCELETAFKEFLKTCPKHEPPLMVAGKPIFPVTGKFPYQEGFLQWHRVGTSWEGMEIIQLAYVKGEAIAAIELINH